MRKEEFLRDAARLKAFLAGKSPVYAALLAAIEASLKSGDPTWFSRLEDAWKSRTFSTWYEAPALLLHGLHHRALSGEAGPLRAIFPTCGGKEPVGDGRRVFECLESAPASFWDFLSRARLQTNEVLRSVGWLLTGCVALMTRGTPFHLVDMGTSAGLNLVGDYLPRGWTLLREGGEPAAAPERWADVPYPVLSRTGLDREPLDLADPGVRLWLRACLGPDNLEALSRFDRAAELFLKLRRDKAGPRPEACPFPEMPAWVASRIKPHPEEGLLLYNSQAADFLDDREYEALKAGITKALEPWEDRGFWAELEMPRDKSSELHELRVHRLAGGRLESRVLARLTAKPMEMVLLPGWDFLRPFRPPRPPRITREEPMRQLQPGPYRFPGASAGKEG